MKRDRKVLWNVIMLAGLFCILFPYKIHAASADMAEEIAFKKYDSTLTIKKGESVTLKVRFTPSDVVNKKLKWTSSNEKIVSVTEKGVIKGIKKGKATITAKTTDGSNKKIKLKVTVGKKVKQVFYQNADELTELKVGESYKLQTGVSPAGASNKKVKWSSSDSSIAKVSTSGKVTALSNGTVTITAEATDGTKKKVKKTIQVISYIKSIQISTESASVYRTVFGSNSVFVKKGNAFQLDTEITPDNPTNGTLVWSSNNRSVATVSSTGKVTTVGCGVAVITAQAEDAGGKKNTFYVYVGRIDKKSCEFIAHRGRSELAPENSVAAITLALKSKFDSVEFDVWKTKDDEFVVSHDESLLRMCGVDAKVTQLTLAQATGNKIISGSNLASYPNEYIPSLEQILKIAQSYPDKTLCIELKPTLSKDMLIKFMEILRDYKLQDRVKVISFSQANLKGIRALEDLGGDEIEMEYLTGTSSDSIIQFCKTYNTKLGIEYTGLTEQQLKKIKENGIELNVWNIPNFFTSYFMIYTMGVDSVTSNYQFFE